MLQCSILLHRTKFVRGAARHKLIFLSSPGESQIDSKSDFDSFGPGIIFKRGRDDASKRVGRVGDPE
jgi:hypothetical protein